MAHEARVIPLQARSCLLCVHARFGAPLTHCVLINEPVVDERRTAENCETYELEEEW